MRIVYLAHPLGAETKEGVEANKARARRWIRWIYDNFKNVAVLAASFSTVDVLDNFNPAHRAHGMKMNAALIPLCSEFWMVGGRISTGMGAEYGLALEQHTRKVFDLTWLGEEPPVDVPEKVRALLA